MIDITSIFYLLLSGHNSGEFGSDSFVIRGTSRTNHNRGKVSTSSQNKGVITQRWEQEEPNINLNHEIINLVICICIFYTSYSFILLTDTFDKQWLPWPKKPRKTNQL